MSTFGARLQVAIDAAGTTQVALAAALGVREATVNEWCQDVRLPKGEHMVRLPGLLGVDGHWLLTDEGDASTAREVVRRIALEIDAARESGVIPWGDLTREPPESDDGAEG